MKMSAAAAHFSLALSLSSTSFTEMEPLSSSRYWDECSDLLLSLFGSFLSFFICLSTFSRFLPFTFFSSFLEFELYSSSLSSSSDWYLI